MLRFNRGIPTKSLFPIVSVLAVLTGSRLAMAQLPTATILGTVRDASGSVVPEAALTAKHLETGLTRTAASAADGSYRFPALPVGAYEVQVEQPGFRTEVRSGLTLTVAQEAVVNFTLQVGAVEQTVAVTAEAPLVNTTSGSLGGLVDERKVAELPLNGRNFMDLTLLQPGVTQQRNLGTAVSTVGLWFSSNGAPLRSNNYLLDGAIMTNLTQGTGASQDGSTPGLEGIREWRVVTNSFSAEYGMRMGSQVVVVTKGGTNRFHGSAFEYLRNSALDARNFFDRKPLRDGREDSTARRLPAFTRNQFGGSVGGPIKQDKTFFFGVYEGLRERLGTTNIATVIPAACHVPTNNPCITSTPPPLPPNPNREVAPVVRPLLDLYPLPNLPNNQFTYPFSQPTRDDYGQVRVDQIFSPADSLFARYTVSDATQINPHEYPHFTTVRASRNQYLTLSEDHIFSPALLSTFRFSLSRTRPGNTSPAQLADGTPLSGPQYSFIAGQEIGSITIGGVTRLGSNVVKFSDFLQSVFTWSGDFFYTRGRHSLKFGTLLNHFRQDIAISVNEVGTAVFANTNNFLQGLTNVYSAITPGSLLRRQYHLNTLGFYVQDDLRLLPRLTFNLGLRYEFSTVPREVNGLEAALRDIQRDAATVVGPIFRNPSLRNFSPRFGFAWDVTGDGQTALRGGFAVLYDLGGFGVSQVIALQGTPPHASVSSVARPSSLTLPFVFRPEEVGKTLRMLEYGLEQPHILDYNLTLERQLPGQIALTIGYAGSRGINLMQIKEGNPQVPEVLDGRKSWPAPPPGSPCTFRRTNPNWCSAELHTAGANSWYNSMQFTLAKQLSHGLQFQSSYTWSKLLDETQGQAGADNVVSNVAGVDPSNRRADKGPADFDLRQNWQFNTIYQLPQPFTGRALSTLLNGWRASSILSVQSGFPFTPSVQTNRSRSGVMVGQAVTQSANVDHPDLLPGRNKDNIILGGPDRYFDSSAFALQPTGFLGTSGRNFLTGPGFFNLDFALHKSTPLRKLGESTALEFRAEFFNILNHANFSLSDVFRQIFAGADPPPGVTAAPLAAAGRITTTGQSRSRQIQFALKLLF